MIKELILKYSFLINQIWKFVVIGFLNTGVDFLIFNLLVYFTGTYKGGLVFILNIISFSIAVINSYFLNKYFTFKSKETNNATAEFSSFIIVSVFGALINSGIVFLITQYEVPFGLSPQLWANFAKLTATFFSLFWNFLGYKFFVFKK